MYLVREENSKNKHPIKYMSKQNERLPKRQQLQQLYLKRYKTEADKQKSLNRKMIKKLGQMAST